MSPAKPSPLAPKATVIARGPSHVLPALGLTLPALVPVEVDIEVLPALEGLDGLQITYPETPAAPAATEKEA